MVVSILALAVLVLFAFWRFYYFLRNPARTIDINSDHILSPADGYIVYIKEVIHSVDQPLKSQKKHTVIDLVDLMKVRDENLVGKPGLLIGIFMAVLDVHYNRSPIAGTLEKLSHGYPGQSATGEGNSSMFNTLSNLIFNEIPFTGDSDYITRNERASYVIRAEDITLYVTQIADKWIRKIITTRDDGPIAQGEIFGLIRMGSQVDLFIPDPKRFEVLVRNRQHVIAGKTVLAKKI